MEKDFPHLVAIDSKGKLVQKIEFMEREKEEMRNLTRASEIADNVFVRAVPSAVRDLITFSDSSAILAMSLSYLTLQRLTIRLLRSPCTLV